MYRVLKASRGSYSVSIVHSHLRPDQWGAVSDQVVLLPLISIRVFHDGWKPFPSGRSVRRARRGFSFREAPVLGALEVVQLG